MSYSEAPHHSEPHKLPQQLYIRIQDFNLENGIIIPEAMIAATFQGLLNSRRDNAILLCHSLSGSAAMEDWWSSALERLHIALDSSKYCLICCNSLGSPYGSASPLTYSSRSGMRRQRYGSAFPNTTIRDDVRIHKSVLDILGVRSIHCVVGEGMGGMLALEWSFYGPEYVRAMVLIATTAKQPSWTEEQQAAMQDDQEVDLQTASRPRSSTASRTADEFDNRPHSEQTCLRLVAEYKSCLDGDCFRHLINKIKSHDVTRARCSMDASSDEALKEVLKQIQQPTLAIEVPTDRLCPMEDQIKLSENIPNVVSTKVDLNHVDKGQSTEAEQLDKVLHTFLDAIPLDG